MLTKTQLLVEMEETIGWMVEHTHQLVNWRLRPHAFPRTRSSPLAHMEELHARYALLQKGEFTVTDQSLYEVEEIANKIMLWCDSSGKFTSDELRGDHEFIECLGHLLMLCQMVYLPCIQTPSQTRCLSRLAEWFGETYTPL